MVVTRPTSARGGHHLTPAAIALSAMMSVVGPAVHAGVTGPSSDMIQPGFEYRTPPNAQPSSIVNLPGPSTAIQSLKLFSLTGAPTPVGTAEVIQDFRGDGTLDLLTTSGVSTRYSGAFNGLLSTRRREGPGGTRATMDSSVLSLTFVLTSLNGQSAQLRSSTGRSSSGLTTVEDLGNGAFRVDGTFDLFLDVSFDSGQTWYAAASAIHLDLVPSPAAATALFGAFGLTVVRRRR